MTIGELWRRLWYLANRRRIERELAEEMASHRGMMTDPRQFGNVLKLREDARDVWGWAAVDRAAQDLRYALRAVRKSPSFSLTVITILAIGIGVNLAFFNVINVALLRPVPVRDPASLVRFGRRGPTGSSSGVPFPATQFIRDHNEVLSAVLTRHGSDAVWDQDPGTRISIAYVSANWFDELGFRPALGRNFSESLDERPGAEPVVMVSESFWRTSLASDPQVIGRTLRLNDRPATIVGVVPRNFPDLDFRNPQIWLPIAQIDYFEPGSGFKEAWDSNNTQMYARLRPGVTTRAAEQGVLPALAALARLHPTLYRDDEWLEAATGEDRFLHGRARQKAIAVAGLFGGLTLLVLLVACANLANLVLSHQIGRLREFSLRCALGASRWRVLRHIVVECGVLAVVGGAGGIAVGYASARLFASFTTEMPPYVDFTPDRRVFAAAIAAVFVAMLAFAVAPAWAISRRDLIRAIKDGGHQASSGLSRARFRLVLVGAQVIGCCALLVVAGSMFRSLQQLTNESPGFSYDRVAVVDPSLERHGMTGEEAEAYWTAVQASVAADPRIERTSLAAPAPLGGTVNQSRYGADSGHLTISNLRVDGSFFGLLDIPFLSGRTFSHAEGRSSVIISRRVALTMYGTLDVLGKGYPRSKPTRTIVGVVGDASVVQLRASGSAEEYRPLQRDDYAEAVLLGRSRTDLAMVLQPLYQAARSPDSRVQPRVRLLQTDYERGLQVPRLASGVSAVIAALVLALASLGIFGVVAYGVKLRTKEIGIRRALGADAPRVYFALVRQLAWPLCVGMLAGTVAGAVASRVLAGSPFHLAISGPGAPAVALLVFVLAALAASILPASRAMRADPLQALRHE